MVRAHGSIREEGNENSDGIDKVLAITTPPSSRSTLSSEVGHHIAPDIYSSYEWDGKPAWNNVVNAASIATLPPLAMCIS